MQMGIDIGCSKLAVTSNGQEIPNLDLKKETDNILRYQKTMSHHKKGSIRHRKAQRLLNKSWQKFLNKRKDYVRHDGSITHLISEIQHLLNFNPSCDGISPLETLN